MLTKKMVRTLGFMSGITFFLILCLGFAGSIANAQCPDDDEFTSDFRLQDCGGFSTTGVNSYFILKPGYKLVLQTPPGHDEPEKAVITVLPKTKKIRLDGRKIYTRVVEERSFEWDDGEWVTKEISLNWFAICKKTNDVYYFGEDSTDCEEGFDEKDRCTGGESTEGSWEAGKNGARPGIVMPGTFLLNAKYFQEMAEEDEAVDRGENVEMGVDVTVPAGSWDDCVMVEDTNPAEGVCEEGDEKIYCPKVGLVVDEELELVKYGFIKDDDDDDDDDDDEDDDDDDDDRRKRWKYKKYRRWH
jgi:hypothetical protein